MASKASSKKKTKRKPAAKKSSASKKKAPAAKTKATKASKATKATKATKKSAAKKAKTATVSKTKKSAGTTKRGSKKAKTAPARSKKTPAKATKKKVATASKRVTPAAKSKPKVVPKPKKKKRVRFTPKERAAFRKQLVTKHGELLELFRSAKGDSRARQSDGTEDYIDYAVSSYDREFSLSLSELERNQLELVERALKRLDTGDYGECLQCATEIPTKRLEVQPWAIYCVRCQELVDQGLLQADFDDEEDDDEDDEPVEEEREVEIGDFDSAETEEVTDDEPAGAT